MTADAVGGVWTYCEELARALPEAQVHLVVMGPPPDAVPEGVFASVRHVDVPLEWMPEPWVGVDAAGEQLLALAQELRPDVVHLNGYVHAALAWPAPVVVVAHSDVVSWCRAVRGEDPQPAFDEYRRRVAAGLRAADVVVAPTRAVADDLAASYGVGGALVVPNCRRDLLGPPVPKQPVVLASGRAWDEAKGLDRLADVLPEAQVAGDGGSLGRLTPEALHARMRVSRVYVSPARYEPFGLGVLEAGLASCALVLADLPSLRELWDGAAAFAADDDELARLARALLDDPGDAGDRARERALWFTPERTAAGYRDVYARLPQAVRP